jgi:phosphatidylglycerol lysyltransferase
MAFIVGIAVTILAVATHIGSGQRPGGAAVPAVIAALLILFRGRFTVRVEPWSVAGGIGMMTVAALVATAYGTFGFWLLDRRDFGIEFRMHEALIRTLQEFLLVGKADLVPHTRMARWFLDSLMVSGATAAATGAYSLFRPLAYRLRTLPYERARARALLEEHGRSPVDFFKLWSDKSYFFGSTGRAFIAYRVSWNVAVALGDPVGPDEEIEPALREFLDLCRDNGWSAAFHQVLPDFLPVYERHGLRAIKIGEEAVVSLGEFAEETSQEKDFRYVRRRLENQGFTATRHLPPHPPELLDAAEEVSREWLSLPGRRERTFTLGQFNRHYVSETPLFTVCGPDGRVLAFANEIPSYRKGEATIDMMRHREKIPNGTMDFLFLRLLLALRSEGFATFSLGLAPFAGVGDEPEAGLQERALHELFEHLNRFFSFRGLRSYKAKFKPEWVDCYLAYQGGPAGLVKAGIALVRAAEGRS